MDTDTMQLIELEHKPIHPPHPCTPGEVIYLKLWQDYLQADPSRLDGILWEVCGETTQRDASVCASFMVYMGCQGGAELSARAERLNTSMNYSREDAYMAAWSVINARMRGTNHGLRTIEYMLAEGHPIKDAPLGGGGADVNWSKVPDLSMRDIDVVECMVRWWATHDAHRMREIAEPLIKAETARHRSDLFKRKDQAKP